MKTLELSTASQPLSAYAQEWEQDTIILLLHNIPVAAIISLRDQDLEALALSTNPEFYDLIEQSRQEIAAGRTLSFEEMQQAIAEMR